MTSVLNKKYSFVFFASGEGSNAENLWKYFKHNDHYQAKLLICDKNEAGVLARAKLHQIPSLVITKNKMDKAQHEKKILEALEQNQFDYILLCGYMKLLSASFVEKFPKKILNIHPSLLPKYPGLHAYERAFHAGESIHGATVHYVDAGMDTGEIILQKSYRRQSLDNFNDFKKRGMEIEYALYPEAIDKVIS